MDAADTVMNRVKPIAFAGVETLSFRQLDELNGLGKGSSFKLFKTHLSALEEDSDYFYVSGDAHPQLLAELKKSEQVYLGSVHLVLLSRAGYEKLQQLSKSVPTRKK